MEIQPINYYFWIAACYATYMLGLFHGKGKKGWQHYAVAAVFGAAWPAAAVYGAWLEHGPKKDGG